MSLNQFTPFICEYDRNKTTKCLLMIMSGPARDMAGGKCVNQRIRMQHLQVQTLVIRLLNAQTKTVFSAKSVGVKAP